MPERPDDLVPTPPPLPAGAAWERLLLESPLPLVAVLLAGALIAYFVLRRRARLGLVAAAAMALAAGCVWMLARQVQTEREEVLAAAAELVDAAAKADTVRLDGLLDSTAVAYTRETPGGMSRGRILTEVRRQLGERHPVREYDIRESQAVIDGPGVARVQLRVQVVEADRGLSFGSWWALDLRRDESGRWKTSAIRPLHPLLAPG